jgi:phosphoglucosamine mutase
MVLKPRQAVLGRDTRASSPALSDAVAAGLASEGVQVIELGVLPTPGVAFAAGLLGCPGFVISASHNPWTDNGIKVLGSGGTKLRVEDEAAIEALLEDPVQLEPKPSAEAGPLTPDDVLVAAYLEHVVDAVGPGSLEGMRIVLDLAHGASCSTAVAIFEKLGAELLVIAAAPNGRNINDSVGSMHPEQLAAALLEHQADLGLAFDGDADRLVAVDHRGRVLPGDVLLALFAVDLKARGMLARDAVVVTVMSNLGFHRAMEAAGIEVRTVDVGDRNVVEAMDAGGLNLGGEQSGHVVFRTLASTGDGVLTGALLAELVTRAGRPLAELADEALVLVPQHLAAVAVAAGSESRSDDDELVERLTAAEEALGSRGRILVRASGTEPVVRVMVEADDDAEARGILAELVDLVERAQGSPEEEEGR